MYQSRAAPAQWLKGWVGLKNIRKRFDLDVLTRPGHTARLSVCHSTVNNKRGREKYIYYDKDRHQVTQTWGRGWLLEGSEMEKTEGNSKSKLHIEDGIAVVKNNWRNCWISILLSIQVKFCWSCVAFVRMCITPACATLWSLKRRDYGELCSLCVDFKVRFVI